MELLRGLLADVENVPDEQILDADKEFDPGTETEVGKLSGELAKFFTLLKRRLTQAEEDIQKSEEVEHERARSYYAREALLGAQLTDIMQPVFWACARTHFAIAPGAGIGIRKGLLVVFTPQEDLGFSPN